MLAGCGYKGTEEALAGLPPSPPQSPSGQSTTQLTIKLIVLPTIQPTFKPTVLPTQPPTPTLFALGPLFDSNLDLRAGQINLPLELQIPSLKVNAPVLGVGLTVKNVMDAPIGLIDDPVWHSAFWYRGGGIPGAPGTATIAAHVDDPLGRPEIFAHLQNLHPGDLIIVHVKNTAFDIRFKVDQVKIYSVLETSNLAVRIKIFGAGPVTGTGPQPAPDGLSHLTLITCAGNYVNGQFDHHTVVYATRIE